MAEIEVGGTRYRIEVMPRDGRWVAAAVRSDTGRRFGTECSAETQDEASQRMAEWIGWQHEHTVALAALQQAEHAYHQTIVGSAFASAVEGPSPFEMQKESLDALEAARKRLDEVRARRPER